jgi:enediyne biosynthesis protein E4
MKREMMDQLSVLKKKNLKHKEFANKTIQALLESEIEGALLKTVNTTQSYIVFNNGKKGHSLSPLCFQAQLSSINDIFIEDINNDNYPDLILVGNLNSFQPQFGSLDANRGIVLLNDKKGSFVYQNDEKTGLNIRGKARQILKSNELYIVARNNDFPYIFEKVK